MTLQELKAQFGDEYPAAVVSEGERLPLHVERKFTRSYATDDATKSVEVSRFMDDSVSISAMELQQEWPTWDEELRSDFCQSCHWLHEQADFPDMLQFIMQHGGPCDWSGIAMSVATCLPCAEAFDVLRRALNSADIGQTANLSQGISLSKHPEAAVTLRRHLEKIWAHAGLWMDTSFINWVAFDATTCIEHLLELGLPPADFEDQVRQLSLHLCGGNRETCRNYLSKYYSWLE